MCVCVCLTHQHKHNKKKSQHEEKTINNIIYFSKSSQFVNESIPYLLVFQPNKNLLIIILYTIKYLKVSKNGFSNKKMLSLNSICIISNK